MQLHRSSVDDKIKQVLADKEGNLEKTELAVEQGQHASTTNLDDDDDVKDIDADLANKTPDDFPDRLREIKRKGKKKVKLLFVIVIVIVIVFVVVIVIVGVVCCCWLLLLCCWCIKC